MYTYKKPDLYPTTHLIPPKQEKNDYFTKTFDPDQNKAPASACRVRTGKNKSTCPFLDLAQGPGGGTHLGGIPPILLPASGGGGGVADTPCMMGERRVRSRGDSSLRNQDGICICRSVIWTRPPLRLLFGPR